MAKVTVRSNLSEMPRPSWCRYSIVVALITFVLIRESRPYVTRGHQDSTKSPKSLVERDEETGFSQSLDVLSNSPIFIKRSKYQTIEVHESHHFGKILKLDGVTQLTERDADSYNEMMAHVPLFQHAHPIRVLVIGGGDGYVVNEVLKHTSVQRVDHVELDIDVIQTCQKFFSWGHVWDDPRVHLHIADGATFVQDAPTGSYDVIIQDSSDPWTWDANGKPQQLPSSVLYSTQHFSSIHRILAEDGVLNFQAETFHFPMDLDSAAEWRQQALQVGFERVRYGSITIATYPMGQIGFMLCEKQPDSSETSMNVDSRYKHMVATRGHQTTYYHPRLQNSAFDLPLWVEQKMYPTPTSTQNRG